MSLNLIPEMQNLADDNHLNHFCIGSVVQKDCQTKALFYTEAIGYLPISANAFCE